MAICNRLEASLTTTAATRRRLLDALLAEALALPPISGNDLWVRVVEMLQQNWAAIEADASGAVRVYFVSDTGGIFDEMTFTSEAEAIVGLTRNGFHRRALRCYRACDVQQAGAKTMRGAGKNSAGLLLPDPRGRHAEIFFTRRNWLIEDFCKIL